MGGILGLVLDPPFTFQLNEVWEKKGRLQFSLEMILFVCDCDTLISTSSVPKISDF